MKPKQTFWFLAMFLTGVGLMVIASSTVAYDKVFEGTWEPIPNEDSTKNTYTIEECHKTPTEAWDVVQHCNEMPGLFNLNTTPPSHEHLFSRDVTEGNDARFRIRTDSSDAAEDSSEWSAPVNLVIPPEGEKGTQEYIALNHSDCGVSGSMGLNAAGNALTATDSTGEALCPFAVPLQRNYSVWVRTSAPSGGANSFHMQVGTEPECVLHLEVNTGNGAWQQAACDGDSTGVGNPPGHWNLAGNQSIKFRWRETGTELQRIFITDSATWNPSDRPALTVAAIPATTTDTDVHITGTVGDDVLEVTVDQTSLPVLTDNQFSTIVPLQVGTNNIEVTAIKMGGAGGFGLTTTQQVAIERQTVPLLAPTDLWIGPPGATLP